MPQRGRAAPAVAESRDGVTQVEPAGEELAAGVMPTAWIARISVIRSTNRSTERTLAGLIPSLTWEPVSGIEPLTCHYKKPGLWRYVP
jgi:hypothetical protein